MSENVDFGTLREELALERAKNEVLAEQLVAAEDALADNDTQSFSDVIPNEDREFWRGRLLDNREDTLGVLRRMRNRKPTADEAKEAPAPAPAAPLHNRVTAKVLAAAPAAAGAPAPAVGGRAAQIRNRAQEIAKREKCSYTAAWGRAEKEIGD